MEQLQLLADKYKITTSGKRWKTIRQLKEQQWKLYFGKESKVPDRIVSLHKEYVRPIVRGKEVKPVEFGAKAHMLLVEGISFIEKLSYDNFK